MPIKYSHDISRIQLATLNTGQPDPVELQLDQVNT